MTTPPPPARFSLVFLDLDGTLVGKDDILTPRMIVALNGALARWLHATSSAPGATTTPSATSRAEWPGHGYAVLANGAIIAEWQSGRVLQKIPIPPDAVRGAIHTSPTNSAAPPLLFGVHAEDDGGKRVYADTLFAPPDSYIAHNAVNRIAPTAPASPMPTTSPSSPSASTPPARSSSLYAWPGRKPSVPDIAVFASHDLKYDCWCAFMNASAAATKPTVPPASPKCSASRATS